jgi:DNA-binding MarR family transcriptional regulator
MTKRRRSGGQNPPSLRAELRQTRPFASAHEEAYLNIMRTLGVLMVAESELFKRHQLSAAQYNVLRILRGAGADGLPCQAIGERLVTRVPDLTRLLDRLEAAGLVCRGRYDDDRRVVRNFLTKDGSRRLAELDGPVRVLHRTQLDHLDPSELRELNRLLVKARQRPAAREGSPD